MPWGKMDDKFHRNRKVRALRKTEAGRDALGVWVYWWSWCLDDPELTGIVPRDELNAADLKAAELLVSVELWDEVDDGYAFHDFASYNPTREKVEHKRAADRERQAAKRSDASRADVASESPANLPRVASTRDPVPSRPVPSQISSENSSPLDATVELSRAPGRTAVFEPRSGFNSRHLERLFSELRSAQPGGGRFKAQRSDYDRSQKAVDWAHEQNPADPAAACRASIGNFLAHASGRERDGWPYWAWANDPGRWFAYVPVSSGNLGQRRASGGMAPVMSDEDEAEMRAKPKPAWRGRELPEDTQ